jgi:hypothetical protein
MTWILYLAVWGAFALCVPGLALYRRWAATGEDDSLCLSDDVAAIGKQKFMSDRLEAIDRWGKVLTTVVVVLGVALLAVYVYVSWNAGLKTAY